MTVVAPVRGRLLNFHEAAIYLGMPEHRLRRLVAKKKIPVIRDGRLGFYEHDCDEWIAAHRTPATGAAPLTLPKRSGRVALDVDNGIDDLLSDIQRRGGSPFKYDTPVESASTAGGDRRRRRESLHA